MTPMEQEGAAWIAREDRGALGAEERAARDLWLEHSLANRLAYLRLKSVWRRADRLAALRSSAPIAVARFSQWRAVVGRAAAIAVLCAFGAGGVGLWLFKGESYATEAGRQEIVRLKDGSTMELNSDTRLTAQVNGNTRKVVLDQGEAYFEVKRDGGRPFVVLAGNRRIVDQGTKFLVRRQGDKVQVIVTEGMVRIENVDQSKPAPPVIVRAKMQAVANRAGLLVTACSHQQMARELGWRKGMLIFDQGTLGELAERFNRYNRKKLVLESETVRQTRLGGSFETTNVSAFARLLQEGFGFRVRDDGDEIRISD